MSAGLPDLLVLSAYLLGVVLFGVWVGRAQKGVADYMLGDRDLPWWGLLFSIVATETSTVTFLSIPGFAFSRDMTWLQLALGFVAGRLVVVALLLPHYFKGEIFTAYEVLDRRFGGPTKQTASLLFIVTRSLADGLRLFLTAIVLQEMARIPLAAAVAIIGVTTIAYTFFGGMKAVVWTDVAQFVIYLLGAAVAFVILLSELPGGWRTLLATGAANGKLRVFDFTWSLSEPHVFAAGALGGLFLTIGSHGADQLMVQRYLCARGEREAGRALALSGLVVLVQFAFFLLIGVGLFCFYDAFPPARAFDHPDRVFARFIVERMPPGLLGLVLGAVFAAAMSTLSSSLNSSATAAVNDLYRPLLRPGASSGHLLSATRAFTIVFGLVQIAVGIGGQFLSASVVSSVLTIAGFTTGIILGVFFLGIFTKRVGQEAALAGMVMGLVGMTVVAFATPLAWPWYAMVGSLGTLALGLLASLVWPAGPARPR
ncbi:MAG TPA: sodium:solute symporter [Vicinamibacteria bacterium]|nr:sodium:solute symporter [Vicinamibacteria bacterium]